jgi:hypothetical protein
MGLLQEPGPEGNASTTRDDVSQRATAAAKSWVSVFFIVLNFSSDFAISKLDKLRL